MAEHCNDHLRIESRMLTGTHRANAMLVRASRTKPRASLIKKCVRWVEEDGTCTWKAQPASLAEVGRPMFYSIESVKIDFTGMPNSFPVSCECAVCKEQVSDVDKMVMEAVAWHIMSTVGEFTMTVRTKWEDVKKKRREDQFFRFEALGHHQYAIGFIRLGEDESDGIVNMGMQWSYEEGDRARIMLTFTICHALPTGILTKWDCPGPIPSYMVNAGGTGRITRLLTDSGYIQRERSKVAHLLTVDWLIPLEEADMQDMQGMLGETVRMLFRNLRLILAFSHRELDLKGISLFNAWSPTVAARWVRKPYTFNVPFNQFDNYLWMASDHWFGQEKVLGELQWGQIARAFDTALTLLVSTWNGHASSRQDGLWTAWDAAKKKCGEKQTVDASSMGLGNIKAYLQVEQGIEDADEDEWANSPLRRRPHERFEVELEMMLKRHYFPLLVIGVKTGVGLHAVQRSQDQGNEYWMLGVDADGCPYSCYEKHDLDKFESMAPLELRQKNIYQMTVDMYDNPFSGNCKPQHRISSKLLYTNSTDMKLAFKSVIANMNALAMMRRMENDIMDNPRTMYKYTWLWDKEKQEAKGYRKKDKSLCLDRFFIDSDYAELPENLMEGTLLRRVNDNKCWTNQQVYDKIEEVDAYERKRKRQVVEEGIAAYNAYQAKKQKYAAEEEEEEEDEEEWTTQLVTEDSEDENVTVNGQDIGMEVAEATVLSQESADLMEEMEDLEMFLPTVQSSNLMEALEEEVAEVLRRQT